jgi:parallel beta-helix repeat protein
MARVPWSRPASAKLAVLALITALWTGGEILAGAPALAVHVSCGDTITTDTTLDSDLVDCPNNGIIIGADDITLDLNGHVIDGDGQAVDPCPQGEVCDFGIANDGHAGVRITRGTVQDFAFGVILSNARTNRLSHLFAFDNVLSGILLAETVRTSVRESVTIRNGGPDSGVGITLFESRNNTIVDNTAMDNAELGIHLIRSDNNLIGHNLVRDNPEDGIIVQGDRNQIVRNEVRRNSITITLFTANPHAIGNVVRRNRVHHAPRGGISIDAGIERTLVKRNHVFRAGGHGIIVGNPTTTLTRNEARQHQGR